MGYRRQPTDEPDDVDVEAIAPHWCARWVWVLRWGDELMGGAECFAHNHRTVYNAGPAEPCLERVRRWWAEKTPEQRRSVWADDDEWVGFDGLEHCPRHDRAVAYCEPSCPTIQRLQREYDATHAHAWTNPTT